MWPEVEEAASKRRHEIRLTSAQLKKRLAEDPGGLQQLAEAVPFLTFVDLSDTGHGQEGDEGATGCITALPDNFSGLSQLHELRCANTALRAIPEGLGGLPLLRTVIVERCLLTQLPGSLFAAPKLHTLICSHNALTCLPEAALLAAGELHYLDVSHNQLAALPAALVRLPKLSTLIASYNSSLSALPARLGSLTSLQDLQLAHCGLKLVPQALAGLPKLKALQLEGNPFEDKKLPKLLKEGRLKNIIAHLKKHGAPPGAEEAAAAAAAAAAKLQLADAAQPYQLAAADKAANLDVHIHPDVKDVRPHLVCAVLRGVKFTPALYEKFIALQTELHEGLCKKRSLAAIGTHDLDALQLPLSYAALPPADIRFVPLVRDKECAAAAGDEPADSQAAAAAAPAPVFEPGQDISADQLGDFFAADKTMLKYLSFIEDRPKKGAPLFAVLRDASGAVLSVSPVINAEACKVSAATHNILIEVSGAESLELVQQVGSQFLEVFAKAHAAAAAEQGGTAAGAQQLCVAPVRLLTVGTGHVRAIWPRP